MPRLKDPVIIIHGTFNAPEPGVRKWYQFNAADATNFSYQLHYKLSQVEGAPEVGEGERYEFYWSGENDHEHRIRAAIRLRDKIIELTKDGATRVHLVAHSHGGNVAIKAVELYYKYVFRRGAAIAQYYLFNSSVAGPEKARAAIKSAYPDLTHIPDGWVEFVTSSFPPDSKILKGFARKFTFALSGRAGGAARNFSRAWMRSPETNRLGRVVCMGTPFYNKQWLGSLSGGSRYWKYIFSRIHALPAFIAGPYLIILLYAWILTLPTSVGFIGFNPLLWPMWLLAIFISISLFIFFASGEPPFENTNIYFFEKELYKLRVPFMPAADRDPPTMTRWMIDAQKYKIPILVISCGFLDEALLALSAEPVVFAHIVPRLQQYFAPDPTVGKPKPEDPVKDTDPAARVERETREIVNTKIGFDSDSIFEAYAGVLPAVAGFLVTAILYIPRKLWAWFYKFTYPVWSFVNREWVKPMFADILLAIVGGAGYGLPARQIRGARVRVSAQLNIPAFFEETNEDILKSILTYTPAPGASERTAAMDRYTFLLNEDAAVERMKKAGEKSGSGAWKTLDAAAPELYERYLKSNAYDPAFQHKLKAGELLSRDQFERELAKIWFTLEERAKEVTGAVELNHSLYYSNPNVIQEIARFLTK